MDKHGKNGKNEQLFLTSADDWHKGENMPACVESSTGGDPISVTLNEIVKEVDPTLITSGEVTRYSASPSPKVSLPKYDTSRLGNSPWRLRLLADRRNTVSSRDFEAEIAALEKSIEKISDQQDRTFETYIKITETFENIAEGLAQSGLKNKAVPLFNRLISAAEKIDHGFYRARVLGFIAEQLAEAGLKGKATSLFEKLIAAAERIQEGEYCGDALSDIAAVLAHAKFEEKAAMFEKIISILTLKKLRDEKSYYKTFEETAMALADADLKDKAIPLFEKLIVIADEKTQDESNRASSLGSIGLALAQAGLKDKALPIFEKLIAAADKDSGESPLDNALLRTNITVALVHAGFKDKALEFFEKFLLDVEKKISRELIYASLLGTIASWLAVGLEGQPEPVLFFEKLIVAAEKIGTEQSSARNLARRLITVALAKLSFREKDLELFEKSLLIVEKFSEGKVSKEMKRQHMETLIDIDDALANEALWALKDKAMPFFEKLIAAAEKIENVTFRILTLRHIIGTLVFTDFKDEAVRLCEKLISMPEKIEDKKDRVQAFTDVASTLARVGLEEKAAAMFEKSISTAKKTLSGYDLVPALKEIAVSLAKAKLKDQSVAVSLFQKLISATEKVDKEDRPHVFGAIKQALSEAGLKNKVALPKEGKSRSKARFGFLKTRR